MEDSTNKGKKLEVLTEEQIKAKHAELWESYNAIEKRYINKESNKNLLKSNGEAEFETFATRNRLLFREGGWPTGTMPANKYAYYHLEQLRMKTGSVEAGLEFRQKGIGLKKKGESAKEDPTHDPQYLWVTEKIIEFKHLRWTINSQMYRLEAEFLTEEIAKVSAELDALTGKGNEANTEQRNQKIASLAAEKNEFTRKLTNVQETIEYRNEREKQRTQGSITDTSSAQKVAKVGEPVSQYSKLEDKLIEAGRDIEYLKLKVEASLRKMSVIQNRADLINEYRYFKFDGEELKGLEKELAKI
jgi:hypothetical protein